MRKIGIALGAGIVALMLASCGGTTEPVTLPTPEITTLSVADSGLSLVISWSPIDSVDGYRIECDGEMIADLPDTVTSYKIDGTQNVCKTIKLMGYDMKGNMSDPCTKELMKEINLTVYGTDDTIATNPSWVKIDFTNLTANAITQGDVDPGLSNVGYFVYYYDDLLGYRYFKDARETSVGQAQVEIAFTDNTTDNIAPSTGYSLISEEVNAGDRFIFWADDVNDGYYGQFDDNDNFGVIKVISINGTAADLSIYLQTVEGLRWVKE